MSLLEFRFARGRQSPIIVKTSGRSKSVRFALLRDGFEAVPFDASGRAREVLCRACNACAVLKPPLSHRVWVMLLGPSHRYLALVGEASLS